MRIVLPLDGEGIEPHSVTVCCDKDFQNAPNQSAAESGAVGAIHAPVGADLQSIIDRWPNLSTPVVTSTM